MDGDVFSNIIGVFTLDTAMDMESQQHQVGLGGMFATGTMDRTTLARLEWLELEPGPLELESWLQPFEVEESFLDDEELEYLQKLHCSK